jgi:hypothetical protein
MQPESHTNLAEEVLRASPPVTVGGLTLFGVGLPDMVMLATLVYTLLQLFFLLRDKWWRQRKGRRNER